MLFLTDIDMTPISLQYEIPINYISTSIRSAYILKSVEENFSIPVYLALPQEKFSNYGFLEH